VGFWPQQPGPIWQTWVSDSAGEAFAAQEVEEHLRMTPSHVGVGLALGRLKAEISPSIDSPARAILC